jgi:DNA-directed RNA polymerase specialized sigma24 family protein
MHLQDLTHDPLAVLRLACRAARGVANNRLVAEEAGELAMHRFQLAVIAGRIPERPEAWIRTVARRIACQILRGGWSRTLPLLSEEEVADPGPRRRRFTGERLRCALRSTLTPRQREALDAALSCRTTREAARTCGMEPRDFRRYLAVISRRARTRFHTDGGEADRSDAGSRVGSPPEA